METPNLLFPWSQLQARAASAARAAFKKEKYVMKFAELWREDEKRLSVVYRRIIPD